MPKHKAKHKPEYYDPMLKPLQVLTAGTLGGMAGLYADKVLRQSETWKRAENWKHLGLIGACATIGAALGMSRNMLHGSGYDYEDYKPEKAGRKGEQAVIAFSGANGGDWYEDQQDRAALDKQFGKNKYALFAYKDMPFAEEYMRRLPPEARLRIIGHSLGGPAAYALAQKALAQGRTVEELDTLDPVGRNMGMSMSEGRPENVKLWNNYYVAKRHPGVIKGSDIVAEMGGAMDAVPGATNIPVEGDHVDHKTIRYALEGSKGKVEPPKRLLKKIYG